MTRTRIALAALLWTCATSVYAQSADSAGQLALAEAQRKAWQAAVTRLNSRPDVKALRLTPVQLEAFTAAIVEIDARFDAADVVRRLAGLRKDQDATYELVALWAQIQRLHQELANQARARASVTQTLTTLGAKLLTARAYAALARTEPTTVGGRIPSIGGRERARQLAEAALALSADVPDPHYVLGDLRVEDEQPVAAEAEYRKALEHDPLSSAGRTRLAAALRLQGNFADAIAELREALRLDPAFARAHSDMGMVLRAQRSLPESIAAYREALRLDPDLIDAHNGLAVALANGGKFEEAVTEFREIVRIDPDSTIGYYNLAYALADLDRDVEAAAALREVVRINPNHYNARFNLGELFRLEGKYDDSARQFREYLRLAPETPQNQRNIKRARGYVDLFEQP